ncbi:MAG: carbohydrate kinase family protein [Patescibacteria group bacterium]
MSKILVSGSLAYDRIMDFPGRFGDHILPNKIHILNVCFVVKGLKESFGGTAGNIAYNLSLLRERSTILSVVGEDFTKYKNWLKSKKIDLSLVKKVRGHLTATAQIITDQDDNQLTAFYGGPVVKNYPTIVRKVKQPNLAIISPDDKTRMLEYAKIYRRIKVPYIFDPGQVTPLFSAVELKPAVKGSKVLIGNDYEIQLISRRLRVNQKRLAQLTQILVITKGSQGSEIYHQGKKIKIPPAKPQNTCDPTGAGDAYRAGLIKGLLMGWPLAKAGRLAGLVAVYTVEKYGTQTHSFTWSELGKRYRENFKEKL